MLIKIFILFLFSASLLQADFIEKINQDVLIALENAEQFQNQKAEIASTWNALLEKGCLQVSGDDKDVRPPFVALQAIMEDVLSKELNHDVSWVQGIILTPMPATPLCMQGEVSPYLVDPSIENDPNRLNTVKSRATSLRDLLHQGALMCIAYAKGGLYKRTESQQDVYREERLRYSQTLVDLELTCKTIPEELIGALYLFRDQAGQTYVFAIKMTQAKDPKEMGHFGLWFGQLDRECILERVLSILQFLMENEIDPKACTK